MKKFYIKFTIILSILIFIFIYRDRFQFIKDSFEIKEIEISGSEKIKDEKIKNIILNNNKKNLFFLNSWKVMREIKNFDLVDEVSVRKIYPNKLSINILEKEPIIIFNQNDKYFIIDKNIDINSVESETLEENDFFKNLIHLEANDIEKTNLIESLKVFFEEKNFINRVSAIYNVGGRRWNIILDRRIKVMLPEDINVKFIEKIFTLVDSLKSNGTIEHDALYVILDLRVKDKVFIKNINDH